MVAISFVQTTLDLCSLTAKVFENVRRPTVIYSYSMYCTYAVVAIIIVLIFAYIQHVYIVKYQFSSYHGDIL